MTAFVLDTNTPLGLLRIVVANGNVIEINETTAPESAEIGLAEPTLSVIRQIKNYLSGDLTVFDFPVLLSGTAFQKSVWEECRKIPYGETRTYAEVAKAIGHPKAVRAVGSALGKNPILLAVPCHRVVAKTGVGGFRLGQSVKSFLMNLEHSFKSREYN